MARPRSRRSRERVCGAGPWRGGPRYGRRAHGQDRRRRPRTRGFTYRQVVPVVVLHPRAEAQIVDVLNYTLEEFGEAKYLEYRDLISLALRTLEVTPAKGKRRPGDPRRRVDVPHRPSGPSSAPPVPLPDPGCR